MHPAALDDAALLAQCDIGKQRTSGPGGQHRNKVETAVNIAHRPTGITAHAGERRSAVDNKRVALRRLRLLLAVEVRVAVPVGDATSELWKSRRSGPARSSAPKQDPVLKSLGVKLGAGATGGGASAGRIVCSSDHHDFPALLAEAMDFIASAGWDLKTAAARLEVSASQLLKLLKDHPPAFLKLNAERVRLGSHPFK